MLRLPTSWECFIDDCVVERDRFGPVVMVFGGISHGVKSLLIVMAGDLTAVRPPSSCSPSCAATSTA